MNGITRTKHFDQRFQQRGLNGLVVWALIHYGERHSSRHGVDSLIFTKAALVEIKNDYGLPIFKACEKLRNAYIVMSEEGMLITVARSYRTVH